MADNLNPAQRSYCMSRVRNKDTDLEFLIRSRLFKRGWRFRKHVASLPGKPDIVFSRHRVAVFVDGDFWHGYRFSQWNKNLSEFWKIKIEKNRARDRKNFRNLKRLGWTVIRLWQHEIKQNLDGCVSRIEKALMQLS
jgi:DNA mismatch endonuclease, patch repair protein